MGSFSIWHWIIVLLLVMVLFGRGKISELMGDVAKGIKTFKKGLAEDEAEKPQTIDHNPSETMTADRAENKTKVG
jgi:sec-independent protein translocase protein TatA